LVKEELGVFFLHVDNLPGFVRYFELLAVGFEHLQEMGGSEGPRLDRLEFVDNFLSSDALLRIRYSF
jgi:hypothetical protein